MPGAIVATLRTPQSSGLPRFEVPETEEQLGAVQSVAWATEWGIFIQSILELRIGIRSNVF